jgi:divalent metal cation (Fe/Co/Zn/Cd) transporter
VKKRLLHKKQKREALFEKKDILALKAIEVRALKAGIWFNAIMAICGYVGYYFADSYALAFDGNFSLVSAVSCYIAMRITKRKDVSNAEYPYGYYSYENVYALLQGILLIAITFYAILTGFTNIFHYVKGETVETLKMVPLLIYTIAMLFFCTGVWLYYRKQLERSGGHSPVLKTETVSAFMDTYITFGTGIALVLVTLIPEKHALSFLSYVGDSIIVILISILIIREPIRIVSQSFFSLVGRTVSNKKVRRRVKDIVLETAKGEYELKELYLFHIGSSFQVVLHLHPYFVVLDMDNYSEFTQKLETRLQKLFPNLILEVLLK